MDDIKKKYSILIVDDDKFLLDMYSLKFQENDFEVHTAFGGEEALEQMKDKASYFDIILLDLVMPAIDGFEVLTRMRAEKLCKKASVIVLSNLGEPSDIEKAQNLEIDGYIVKASATPSEVVKKVLEVVEKG